MSLQRKNCEYIIIELDIHKYELVQKVKSAGNESEVVNACVHHTEERRETDKSTWFTQRYFEKMMSSLAKLAGLKSVFAVV